MSQYETDQTSKKTYINTKVLGEDGEDFDFSALEDELPVSKQILGVLQQMLVQLKKIEYHLMAQTDIDLSNEEL